MRRGGTGANMILYPAIDLKDGQCVRLLRGEMDKATVFGTDPAAQARAFEAAGCRWLHIVDLNGAFAGRSVNGTAVEAILAAVSVPVQLGGGIRDRAAIDAWLDKGVARVVLGTVAVNDPDLPNVTATAALAGAVAIPVIASGGIASLDDLRALKASGAALDGAISGRALYEGRIDLAEAVRLLAA
ncbi:MAG: 1-(5-phosphoribosyl)-5-((5-phosphoribosylamino)methylideneamino) imidazole-4-carboxamide isomerase [Firmicutes bacterium ADurb.Bin467]|nr:MAG: 1-(5-phosphoribosyl)-5-((5-phosphoribosylamino)methylideneamino) imidazole-4-carboxamide isomerase [Firmicutes bacterium ADurb.Bin467]